MFRHIELAYDKIHEYFRGADYGLTSYRMGQLIRTMAKRIEARENNLRQPNWQIQRLVEDLMDLSEDVSDDRISTIASSYGGSYGGPFSSHRRPRGGLQYLRD